MNPVNREGLWVEEGFGAFTRGRAKGFGGDRGGSIVIAGGDREDESELIEIGRLRRDELLCRDNVLGSSMLLSCNCEP